ncbi:VWA domain-containing protein [Oscillibacter valericigenes]|uniref:VWA domain-containing protein n=1 Tax=Oscillibacter valericigenes TaxID=351091 RepID=UPI001F2F5501|nr:VWA domain-containing protein [Oscillibacter valericigenes]MCF2615872.1 VWA domain-containing protein [Oscillibacter valericigenes]
MRHLKILLSLCLAMLLVPVSAYAAGEVDVVQTLVQDDTLYLWMDTSALSDPVTQVNAETNGVILPVAGTLQTVAQVDGGSYCIFLLDRSGSMPKHKQEILNFMDAYTATCPDDSKYALATFGDEFELVADDLDGEDLAAALDQVSYSTQNTRLYEGTAKALDHLAKRQRRGGEIHSLVLLTDGVEDAPSSAVTFEELLELASEAGVLLHAVGFGDDQASLEKLQAIAEAGGGRCGVPGAELRPAALAEQMTAEMNLLRMATFDLSGYTGPKGPQSVKLTLAAGAQLLGKTEAVVNLSGGTGSGMETQTVLPDEGSEEKDHIPPTAEEREPEAPSAEGALPEVNAELQDAAAAEKETPAVSSIVIAGAVAAVAAVVLAVVAFMKRKKRDQPEQSSEEPVSPDNDPNQGIYMRLEVEQGTYIGKQTDFGLEDELLVGLGGHIAFSQLPARSARIFAADGVVYIEPLEFVQEVCVNGLPIAMPNILRSGDIITIGETQFCLKF